MHNPTGHDRHLPMRKASSPCRGWDLMTSFGLHIGCPWSFVIISISQCVKIFEFLLLVEEKELVEKFGKAYESYRRKVPMIFTNPDCAIRVLHRSIDDSPK